MKNFSFVSIFLIVVLIFNAHTSLVIWILLGLFSAIDVTIMVVGYKAEKKRNDAINQFMSTAMDFTAQNGILLESINQNQKAAHDQALSTKANLQSLRLENKTNAETQMDYFKKILAFGPKEKFAAHQKPRQPGK